MAIHGVQVKEATAISAPPIPLPNISAIGLVGSAPGIKVGDADDPGKFTKLDADGNLVPGINEPYLVLKRGDAPSDELGEDGTLPQALDAIFAQQPSCRVIMVPVEHYEDGATLDITGYSVKTAAPSAAKDFQITTTAGKTSILFADIQVTTEKAKIAAVGIGQVITIDGTTSLATPPEYRVTGDVTGDPTAITAGTAMSIPVRLITDNPTALSTSAGVITMNASAQVGADELRGAATGDSDDRTGVYALLSGKSRHGFAPRILTCAGIQTGGQVSSAQNPLGAAMETVAGELRAIAYIDANADDLTEAIAVADDYGSDRVYLIDPRVKTVDTKDPKKILNFAGSAFAAGLTMQTDANIGWWAVPSNKLVNNVLGTERDIDFEMGSDSSRAQLLNDEGIATFVNIGGGFRLWGDYTQASGDRVTWQFLNVRRIADAIYDAIAENHLWAVDRNITKNYLSAVADGVNKLLRDLRSLEAIVGGTCYPDPDLNTERNISLGIVNFIAEFTPVYPARTVNFSIQLNTRRLADLATAA